MSEPIDRFRFNALMAFGVLWVALTGACTGWFFSSYTVPLIDGRFGPVLYVNHISLVLAAGAVSLLPGIVLWRRGWRAGDYSRTLTSEHMVWRLFRAVGLLWAIWLWAVGALGLCLYYAQRLDSGIDWMMARSLAKPIFWVALIIWLPGWIMYWISRRP